MTAADYNVRAEIRAAVEGSDLTDPRDIAAKVAENVPAKQLRAVLAWALTDVVRIMLHGYPSWARKSDTEAAQAAAFSAAASAPKGSSRSAKVAAVRAWARILRKPVAVERNEWKHFGDCTFADLLFLAADRRQNAAESFAAAEKFEQYAKAMEAHGVARVSDLPDEVIASIEGGVE